MAGICIKRHQDRKMRRVKVISKKYDGSLRDEYESYLYAHAEQTIILFSVPGTKYWSPRNGAWLEAPDGLLEIYFQDKWYNVWHICEQVSQRNLIYANVAMPATLTDNGVEWIDLDLDYRLHLDDTIERLDELEFEHNMKRFGYSPEVVEHAWAACREVEAGLATRTFPFDHERQVELYHRIKSELYPA